MRTRSGWAMPPSGVSACAGGSPSAHTPSSSARRSSGWCDARTRSWRWWSNVGYRKKRSWSSAKCLPGSRIPPLRRVTSCSPSASARTVTAHSLKAIGIRSQSGSERVLRTCDPRRANLRRAAPSRSADPGDRHILCTNSRDPIISLQITYEFWHTSALCSASDYSRMPASPSTASSTAAKSCSPSPRPSAGAVELAGQRRRRERDAGGRASPPGRCRRP